MKKRIKKNKIPAYVFGMDQIQGMSSLAQLLGTGIQAASDETSGANIAGSTISGLGTGAAAGAMFGPIGAGIGAAVGGIGGAIKGVFNKKAIEEQERREETSKLTQYGMNTAANNAQEYYSKNGVAYTFENGGILPDLAYVDNDEILRSIDGDLVKVPNTTNGTDQHLIDASNLESVLSDKIKRPGTKRTFAQEGKKLLDMTKPSKGKDKFAENTNRLNKINANKAYEALLAEQESVKMSKGVKPKVKGIPAYEDGKGKFKVDEDLLSFWNVPYDFGIGRTSTTPELNYLNNYTPAGRLPWLPYKKGTNTVETSTTGTRNTTAPTTRRSNSKKIETSSPKASETPEVSTPSVKEFIPVDIPQIDVSDITDPELKAPVIPTSSSNSTSYRYPNLLSLTPTLYNFIQSLRKPEIESTVTNPYSGTIRSTLAKRRANINDILESNRRNRAISNYNLSQLNTNTGSSLAARIQAAVANAAADAAAYTQASNINNQYLGDYANMLNNLGQQFVQSQTLTNDLNARNRAPARNFGANAASQIGKWSQVNTQMNNRYNRDMMMLPFLEDFLREGYTKERVDELYNRTKNRT